MTYVQYARLRIVSWELVSTASCTNPDLGFRVSMSGHGSFQKWEVPDFGVPIIRILLIICVAILGSPLRGNSHMGQYHMGVSENRGPWYSTLNSRILILRTPKLGTPNFRNLPYGFGAGLRLKKGIYGLRTWDFWSGSTVWFLAGNGVSGFLIWILIN